MFPQRNDKFHKLLTIYFHRHLRTVKFVYIILFFHKFAVYLYRKWHLKHIRASLISTKYSN